MQSILLRFLILALLGMTSVHAAAQQAPADLAVVVTEHPTTADMVEITAFSPTYPTDLLQAQIAKLGELLNSAPRGVMTFRSSIPTASGDVTFVKAKFAVDGLIDRAAGELRIEPLIKAFAGAQEPFTIHAMTVLFDGEKPNENTVKNFSSEFVAGQARIVPSLTEKGQPGIEYAITLLSQDSQKLSFPSKRVEPKGTDAPSQAGGSLPMYVWAAIIVAGLSAGALVYLALARRTPARR